MAEGHQQSDLRTPANIVTLTRIVLIPVFVAILVAPWPQFFPDWMDMPTLKPWLAAAVFIILSLTDTLDGYLARSRNEITDFGKFIDPIADKLLVTAALLGLIELDVIPSWVALIIVSREFIVSGVRMIAASKGEVIAASWYGKVKTVFQMIAVVLFIVKDSHVITDYNALWHDGLYLFSWFIMFAALLMTIISMFDYLYKARFLLGIRKSRDAKQIANSSSIMTSSDLYNHAEATLDQARKKGLSIASAESCTGGLISGVLTAVPGSSDVFLGGIVSYTNEVKKQLLGVDKQVLETRGAVSEQTACQMALGVRDALGADVALSVTGIAGPGGATPGKPVGTVWVGVSSLQGTRASLQQLSGSREEIRSATVAAALSELDAELGRL